MKLTRKLAVAGMLLACAAAWSATDRAAVYAAGWCECAYAAQVWIGESMVGGDEDTFEGLASSSNACAVGCHQLAGQLSQSLCQGHQADYWYQQFWWAFDNPVSSDYVEFDGPCGF